MKKLYIIILLIPGALLMYSCRMNNRSIPFPATEKEYAEPGVSKLTVSDPLPVNKIKWSLDTMPPGKETRINFAALPTRIFDSSDFKALNPHHKITLIADTSFSFRLDQMAEKKLVIRKTVLNNPEKVKAAAPRLKDGATEAILMYGQDPGFPGPSASGLFQDRNGFLWFITDKGVCRFNGEEYELFTRACGLSSSYINGIVQDSSGRIWLAASNGVDIIDFKEGVVINLKLVDNRSYIYNLIKDAQGRIWMNMDAGIGVIDEKNELIRNFIPYTIMSRVSSIINDADGNLWITSRGGNINIINEKASTLTRFTVLKDTTGYAQKLVRTLSGLICATTKEGIKLIDIKAKTYRTIDSLDNYTGRSSGNPICDSLGQVWLGSTNGVYVIDKNFTSMRHIGEREGLIGNYVFDLLIDRNGQLWVGNQLGLDRIDLRKGLIKHFRITSQQGYAEVSVFKRDHKGRLWIGYFGNGIDIIDSNNLVKHIEKQHGLYSDYISSFFEDRHGRMWVGASTAVNIIDEGSGTIRTIGSEQGLHTSNNSIHSIMQDDSDHIWIATIAGIEVYNEKDGSIVFNQNPGEKILTTTSWNHVLIRDNEKVWVCGGAAVNQININTHERKMINGIKGPLIDMVMDDKGRLWVGGYEGLFFADPVNNTVSHFTRQQGLSDNKVVSVAIHNGIIYAGTIKGLTTIAPSTNQSDVGGKKWDIRTFSTAQGLAFANFRFWSKYVSQKGELWWGIGNVLTIMKAPGHDPTVSTCFITGIEANEKSLNYKAVSLKLSEGDTLWTRTADSFYTAKHSPGAALKKLNIQLGAPSGSWNMPDALSVPYQQDHLTFYFTGGQLDNSDKMRYRYILEGNDDSWSSITDKAFADYRNLSPGHYTFKAASRGFNGVWSKPAEFSFTIRPPWWLTWWAYIVYAFALIGAVITYSKYRSRKLILKNVALEKKIHDRTVDLKKSLEELKTTQTQLVQSEKMASLGELTAGIAHEIQNPLNFINNFAEVNTELSEELIKEIDNDNTTESKAIAADIIHNSKKILEHGQRADSIVKNMLQHSRLATGEKQQTDINALTDEYLRLSYHGLRAKDKSFNCIIETHFDPSAGMIGMVPQEIGRVLLNLFNNAFYSMLQKKKLKGNIFDPVITVSTAKTPEGICITVKDNGLGIPQKVLNKIYQPFFTTKPTGEGTGLGLSLSYDIITKGHGGELTAASTEGEFAEFFISLPS